MQTPAVVVKKGGFFSAVASGLFGLLTIGVLCATGLAVYGTHVADKHLASAVGFGGNLLKDLPKLRENLPPVLADALRDRRAPEYREKVNVTARLADGSRHNQLKRAVIEITNNGDETITVMAVNVTVQNSEKTPVDSLVAYVATPLAIEKENWRGPILPGSTRQIVRWVDGDDGAQDVRVEISELRLSDDTASSATSKVARATE